MSFSFRNSYFYSLIFFNFESSRVCILYRLIGYTVILMWWWWWWMGGLPRFHYRLPRTRPAGSGIRPATVCRRCSSGIWTGCRTSVRRLADRTGNQWPTWGAGARVVAAVVAGAVAIWRTVVTVATGVTVTVSGWWPSRRRSAAIF